MIERFEARAREEGRHGTGAPGAVPSSLRGYPSLGTIVHARSPVRCARTAGSRTHKVSSLTRTAKLTGRASASSESSTTVLSSHCGIGTPSTVHRVVHDEPTSAGRPRSSVLVRTFGWLLVCSGVLVLIQAFARFVREGLGTPAPVAPTKRLVVGGLYRYVRDARCMDVALEGRPAVWPVVLLRGFAARGGSGRLLRARDMRGMK